MCTAELTHLTDEDLEAWAEAFVEAVLGHAVNDGEER